MAKNMSKATIFFTTPEQKEALLEASRKTGLTMSEIIRRAVDRYMSGS